VLDERHPDGKPALPGLCDCVDRRTSSDYRWVTTARRAACRSGAHVRSESSSERSGTSRARLGSNRHDDPLHIVDHILRRQFSQASRITLIALVTSAPISSPLSF
jgi:hypothetical protein